MQCSEDKVAQPVQSVRRSAKLKKHRPDSLCHFARASRQCCYLATGTSHSGRCATGSVAAEFGTRQRNFIGWEPVLRN